MAEPYASLALALGLGLLVGLQRERAGAKVAGIRTFGLFALLGALLAVLSDSTGRWIVGAGLLAVVLHAVVGHYLSQRQNGEAPGLTTEIAAVVMYVVGALTVFGPHAQAVAIGGTVFLVLYVKLPLHRLVLRMGDKDLSAIAQFVLISLVILPVLPDRTYDPFHVLNPRQVWWMVVLVVSLSLAGYVGYKLIGEQRGMWLGGVLGGMVSSTATTVSFARRAAHGTAIAGPLAAIMLASTVLYVRLFLEIRIVAPTFLRDAIGPLAVLMAVSAVVAVACVARAGRSSESLPPQSNPTELVPALFFAALYAIILVAVAAGRHWFGDSGTYVIAVLSGVHDMDAITLSSARLVERGDLTASVGWRAVVLAAASNTLFKAAFAGALGGRRLFMAVAPLFGITIVVAGLLVWLWPW